MTFHLELRDTLFASGLPCVLSINDVPEAWELYSGADSIMALFQAQAAGAASGQSCCQRRNGWSNPAPDAG